MARSARTAGSVVPLTRRVEHGAAGLAQQVGCDAAKLDVGVLQGGETLLGDKGYAGRAFAIAVSELDATIVRPRRRDEPGHPHLAPIRQRIESIFWTCKDILTLERHGARTRQSLRERVLQRFVSLAAASTLNHQLGRHSRALVTYCA